MWRGGAALAAALAAAAQAAGALAQASAPPAPPRPPASAAPRLAPGQDDIVVTAPREQNSIDRQTYIVRDTAESRSATSLDILSRIPSIEVQPDNSIRLVGAGSATILIDGRRVPGDPATVLRSLQGAQIERVEVMTNPGAQFPAQGTGGIVNIVTRRSFQNGLGGSATASGGLFGYRDLRLAPTYGARNWVFSGNAGYFQTTPHESYERERYTIGPGGPALVSSEVGRERDPFRIFSTNGSASYRPTDHQTITLSGSAAHGDFSTDRSSLLIAPAIPGGRADQSSSRGINYDSRDATLDYRGTSARPGETLTASAKWSNVDQIVSSLLATDPIAATPTLFSAIFHYEERQEVLKADYVRPLGGLRRLSFGGQLTFSADRIAHMESGNLPLGTGSFAGSSLTRGHWVEHAGYLTYQFGLAGFTILPGLRIEGREYRLRGAAGAAGLDTTHVFPSLHLERTLAPWLTADASYSRRVTYPEILQLDPALRYIDATSANVGNPFLRAQLTDSFEAKLHATLTHHNVDLTIFRRATDDIWSPRSELNANGVLVTGLFNFGNQALSGGELSARGPLARGLRYVATATVADQSLDRDGGGPLAARHNATYGLTGQLEYRDGTEGRRGADRVNLTFRYAGANDFGFARITSYASASATWSHAITDRLSAVLTISEVRLTRPRELIGSTPTSLSREVLPVPSPQRATFSLTWSFRPPGQGPQVRQQPATGPAIPTPQ